METGWVKLISGPLWDQKGDEKIRKLTLLISLAVAVLVLGLSMSRPAVAEQSTVGPDSSDISQATPSSLAPNLEDDDSDLDSKRGRMGGGRGAGVSVTGQ